jgi:hypothetical protein
MNTAELIYQDLQTFPEYLALEVLDFVEFLKAKNLALLEKVEEIEDSEDLRIVAERKNEPSIPFDEVLRELNL